jgi:site-specific DNA-adenine methylase
MDYVNMRIKGDIDKDKDNYIDKNKFVFNSYKTAKVYGKQELSIPKPLQTILKKWIAVNPTDYLLFDTNGNKLTNVKLNQRFNKIFGKKASVNAMRHTYLTDKYKPLMEQQKKMAEDMKDMGSNANNQASTYVKLD